MTFLKKQKATQISHSNHFTATFRKALSPAKKPVILRISNFFIQYALGNLLPAITYLFY
jgi:hypothetical protein